MTLTSSDKSFESKYENYQEHSVTLHRSHNPPPPDKLKIIMVTRQSHGQEHLRPEHARVSDLNPLVEAGVERKDLHAGNTKSEKISSTSKAHLGSV